MAFLVLIASGPAFRGKSQIDVLAGTVIGILFFCPLIYLIVRITTKLWLVKEASSKKSKTSTQVSSNQIENGIIPPVIGDAKKPQRGPPAQVDPDNRKYLERLRLAVEHIGKTKNLVVAIVLVFGFLILLELGGVFKTGRQPSSSQDLIDQIDQALLELSGPQSSLKTWPEKRMQLTAGNILISLSTRIQDNLINYRVNLTGSFDALSEVSDRMEKWQQRQGFGPVLTIRFRDKDGFEAGRLDIRIDRIAWLIDGTGKRTGLDATGADSCFHGTNFFGWEPLIYF